VTWLRLYKARATAPTTIAKKLPATLSVDAAPVNSTLPLVVGDGLLDAITVPFPIGPEEALGAAIVVVVPLPALDDATKPLHRPLLQEL